MKKLLPALLAAGALLVGSPVWADTLIDPLHGEVCTSGAAACNTDNGSFGPIQLNASGSTSFGWSFSGPNAANQIGNLVIAILAPQGDGFTSPTLTGTNIPNPGLLFNNVGLYTQGDLSTFLGINGASPSNPFSAFQVGLDTSVTGFNVWTLDVPGLLTLAKQGSPLSDFFTASGGNLSAGISIVAFLLNTADGNIATAPSGQLQVQGLAETPIPGAVFMFGPAILGAWYWLRRRAKSLARLAAPSGMAVTA